MDLKASQRRTEIAEQVIRDYQRRAGNRGTFESHWNEIAQRIWPNYSNTFTSSAYGSPPFGTSASQTPGSKRTQELYDSTAAIALNRFGAILDSLLTPRNQTWHRLMASDPHLNKDRRVRLWFEEVNRILFDYRYSVKANFASQNQQNYKSLGSFGTGCVFADELSSEPGLRYRAIHLGEIFFSENHQGIIDTAERFFPLTARQAIQKWGKSGMLPDGITSAVGNNPDREFQFIHCVKPRQDLDPTRKDYKGMAYASYYVSMEGRTLIEEGGYSTFPYAISRYEQVTGEVYGRSPAMDVLPAIKTLNEEKKTMLKQGHRTVDPVLLAHDDGILDSFSLKPGAINAGGVTADGRPLVHALPVGNLAVGKELMDDERVTINDAFLVNLFQVLTENPQMTATEVLERSKEKGILLAPTIGRQQSEYLGPLVEREIDLLVRQRLLPPMPPLLAEAHGDYKVVYDSPLSRAQRAEEASGLMRTVETALNIVNVTQNPEPLDFFDWDIIIPEVSEIQGVPARWMKDKNTVAQIREDRAKQGEQQAMIQAAPGAAAMIKATSVAQKGKA